MGTLFSILLFIKYGLILLLWGTFGSWYTLGAPPIFGAAGSNWWIIFIPAVALDIWVAGSLGDGDGEGICIGSGVYIVLSAFTVYLEPWATVVFFGDPTGVFGPILEAGLAVRGLAMTPLFIPFVVIPYGIIFFIFRRLAVTS